MTDKKGTKRAAKNYDALKDELTRVKALLAQTENDLNALKSSMRAIIKLDDLSAEELAVGLALLSAITSSWPRAYAPDMPRLAASARVDVATVQVALNAFDEGGVLRPGDAS